METRADVAVIDNLIQDSYRNGDDYHEQFSRYFAIHPIAEAEDKSWLSSRVDHLPSNLTRRAVVFHECLEYCVARNISDGILLFRVLSHWPILNALQALLDISQEDTPDVRGMRPKLRRDDLHGMAQPQERIRYLQQDLATATNELETLCDSLSQLGAILSLQQAHAALQAGFAMYASAVLPARDWAELALIKGRYWRSFLLSPPPFCPDRRYRKPREMSKLAINVARCHFRAQGVHGTLLLENISQEGALRNLSTFEKLGESDVEKFAEDLALLRNQLMPAEWSAFRWQYSTEAKSPVAEQVIARAEELVPSPQTRPNDGLPGFQTLAYPHWIIGAIDLELRHSAPFEEILSDLLSESLVLKAGEQRVKQLEVISCAASGLSDNFAGKVTLAIIEEFRRQLSEGTPSRALVFQLCECRKFLSQKIEPWQALALQAQSEHAEAATSESADLAFSRYRQASNLYLQTGIPALWQIALACLDMAAEVARDVGAQAQVICDQLSSLVSMAMFSQDAQYVRIALELGYDPEGLPEPHRFLASSLLLVAEALLQNTTSSRSQLLRRAKEQAQRVTPDSVDLLELIDGLLGDSDEERPEPDRIVHGATLQFARQNGDWEWAVQWEATALEKMESDSTNSLSLLAIQAGYVAMAYAKLVELDGTCYGDALKEVAELRRKFARHIPDIESEELRRVTACNFGWALASLSVGEDELDQLREGIALLELAVSLGGEGENRAQRSIELSNLANANVRLSGYCNAQERMDLLVNAEQMLRRVVAIDEKLAISNDAHEREIGETLDLDYMHLGRIQHALARQTYTTTFISIKSKTSANFFREAIASFAHALQHSRSGSRIAAQAHLGLARSYTDLCKHYFQERHWAGGDIQHAFYEWMATVAEHDIPTWKWVALCAESALQSALASAQSSSRNDPRLLLESFEAILELWTILRRADIYRDSEDDVPQFVRQYCTLSIAQIYDQLYDMGSSIREECHVRGFDSVALLARAMSGLDIFRELGDLHYLVAATAILDKCTTDPHPLVRGITQTYRRWFNVEQDTRGYSVNGLYLGTGSAAGAELRLPDYRRSITFSEVQLLDCHVALSHRSNWLSAINHSVVHLEPFLNLDAMPEYLATGKGVVKGPDGEFDVDTVHIPLSVWDAWIIQITPRRQGSLILDIGLPYIGRYDPQDRQLEHRFPNELSNEYQVLCFGQRGLSVEVLYGERLSSRDPIRIEGTLGRPLVRVGDSGCMVLIKAAPRIANCETAVLVKDEGADSALCCTVSPPTMFPTRSFLGSALTSYAPLYFFKEAWEQQVLSLLHEYEARTFVVVGLPDRRGELARLIALNYQPNREFLLLITESERESLNYELDQLRRSLSKFVGAEALFASETIYVGERNLLSNIQTVVVPRRWVPAAELMLLDLSASRHAIFDGMPIFIDGKVSVISSLGNPRLFRRYETSLAGISSFDSLLERYGHLQRSGHWKTVWSGYESNTELVGAMADGKLPERAAYILPNEIRTCVARAPHIRLNQAIPIPVDDMTSSVLKMIRPNAVYSSDQAELFRITLPPNCAVISVPPNLDQLYLETIKVANEQFEGALARITDQSAQLLAQRSLLDEILPGRYALLATWSATHATWAIALANYAAAMGGPILLADELDHDVIQRIEDLLHTVERLKDPILMNMPSAVGASEQQVSAIVSTLSAIIGEAINREIIMLDKLGPTFVGIATPYTMVPFELAGNPPLVSRFATGRLSGPDLATTCELVSRAALSEEVSRRPLLDALLVCASGQNGEVPLANAIRETEAARIALDTVPFINAQAVVDSPDDRSIVEARLQDVDLFHFIGHARRGQSGSAELMLAGGAFDVRSLPSVLYHNPFVFANACSSADAQVTSGQTTHSLAAEFLRRGAVNYLGNLWPVLDPIAAGVSEMFYHLMSEGHAAGEALQQARQKVSHDGGSSWAAMMLFGCPRNRLVAK